MQNLNALRDEVSAINKANGWHEQERSFGESIALVHSEVSEALEDYRNGKAINETWYEHKFPFNNSTVIEKTFFIQNDLHRSIGKPCGIPSELADIVIRILDICGLYGWDIEEAHQLKITTEVKSFGSHLASIHKSLSDAYNDGKDTSTDPVIDYLDIAIQEVEFICAQHNIDLKTIIRQKLEYNKTRGYKHGGKLI